MDHPPPTSRDRDWIKRAPRIDAEHEGLVVDSNGRVYPVKVLDISSQGFKLQADETFRIGEYIGLHVSKYGEFSAQIRWALGNEAGGVFLSPVVLPSSE